jgi:hypothetical protein
MGLLAKNTVGAIIRVAVQTVIGVACLMFQFDLPHFVVDLIGSPPAWLVSPLARVCIVLVGVAIIVVIQSWDRLFASPLDRARRRMVDRAFLDLAPRSADWAKANYTSGRPPHDIGETLFNVGLVERDFVGFTEVKPELKLLVASKVRTFSLSKAMPRVTSLHAIIGSLAAAIFFVALAVGLLACYQPQIGSTAGPATILEGSPLAWSKGIGGNFSGAGESLALKQIQFNGKNIGTKEIALNDAFLISGITGARLDLFVNNLTDGKGPTAIKNIFPIPPGADIFLAVELPSMPKNIFITDWGTTILITQYEGKEHRITFDRNEIEKSFAPLADSSRPDPNRPRVTRRPE